MWPTSKVCCRQTANLESCSLSVISTSSFTLFGEATTGTSGTHGFPFCFEAWPTTCRRRTDHLANVLACEGGITGGSSIKVDNMVPACCECNPGGSIADTVFQKRLWLPRYGPSATVRHHTRQ